jgi:hypothetical protein
MGVGWIWKNEKKLFMYCMKDGIFMYFIRELKLFVKLKAIMFVKIPLKFFKAIGLVSII